MLSLTRPMTNGAEAGAMNGFAGSRTAHITRLQLSVIFLQSMAMRSHTNPMKLSTNWTLQLVKLDRI